MKHFSLFLSVFMSMLAFTTSGQQKVFKIAYQFADPETGTDTAASEFIKALASSGETLMLAYIGKDHMRVESLLFGKSVQITNIGQQTSYLLDENSKTYTATEIASGRLIEISEGSDYAYSSDFEINLIPDEKKTIAGVTCKKATFNVAGSEDKETEITVWYAENIPKLYWGTYDYLEKVPGAALYIGAQGLGVQATKVEEIPFDKSLFDIPEGYEEGESEAQVADSTLNGYLSWYKDADTEYFGVQDEVGNRLTPAKYSSIYAYVGNYAIVSDAALMFGLIDLDGNEVIPCQYEFLSHDTEGAPLVYMKDQKYGLLDTTGKQLLPAKYDFISIPNLSYALYNEGDLTGVLDLKGNVLIPAKYEVVAEYRDNLALILEDETYQLVDKSGKNLLPAGQEYISFAGEKLLLSFKNDKYGYIDYAGKVVIPFKFQMAQTFENGLALVSEDFENFYYIDVEGKFIKKYEE